ncbi:hypothetical protein PENSPDRAFT_628290 [Peniophora sp. CONT]|nr:hypothetical protein PENSPDRAFT_628290 [Peniophora sp. CONT]
MFFWSALSLVTALASSSALAAPSSRGPSFKPLTQITGCDIPSSVLQDLLPANQTALVAPSSAPNFLALGVGVQNYTCSSTGTFTHLRHNNIGAVAELFDISCLVGKPDFDSLQTKAFEEWSASPQTAQELIDAIGKRPIILGQHFFIANPAGSGANVPKFDFTSGRLAGDAQAFVVASKVGDILAPTGADDVDWLELNQTSGALASQVFRVATVAGTDGAACTAGETASAKYVAKYFFY